MTPGSPSPFDPPLNTTLTVRVDISTCSNERLNSVSNRTIQTFDEVLAIVLYIQEAQAQLLLKQLALR